MVKLPESPTVPEGQLKRPIAPQSAGGFWLRLQCKKFRSYEAHKGGKITNNWIILKSSIASTITLSSTRIASRRNYSKLASLLNSSCTAGITGVACARAYHVNKQCRQWLQNFFCAFQWADFSIDVTENGNDIVDNYYRYMLVPWLKILPENMKGIKYFSRTWKSRVH